jgi:hypothetical protein
MRMVMELFVGKAIFIVCTVLAILVLYKVGTLLLVLRKKP